MPRGRGKACAVNGCLLTATRDLPLGDGTELDVGVCGTHHAEIEAAPGEWKITSVPVGGSKGERTVVTRIAA